MVGYAELSKLDTFSMEDVFNLVGNKKTASSLVLRLIKKGWVKRIKNNLYSCVNPADGRVATSKYHIACGINKSAYISHHSAFEYYGMANQVYYEMYVSSNVRFKDFEFEGISYRFVASKLDLGIVSPRNTQGIRVTSLERTVIDGIKDFEKIGGFEELLQCLSLTTYIDEKQLISILDAYDNKFLYQKTGYILNHFKDDLKTSDDFLNYCKSKIGKSTRYLASNGGTYSSEWRLVVLESLFDIYDVGSDLIV